MNERLRTMIETTIALESRLIRSARPALADLRRERAALELIDPIERFDRIQLPSYVPVSEGVAFFELFSEETDEDR